MRHVCDTVYPNPLDSSIVNYNNCRDSLFIETKQNLLTIRFSTIVFPFWKDTKFIISRSTVTPDQLNDITKAVLVISEILKTMYQKLLIMNLMLP
jgi:hypothetical protein